MDYQIGEDIKEKIIPRAIDYFTGKALEYEMISDDEDEDDYEDVDDDEDGFEDEDVSCVSFHRAALVEFVLMLIRSRTTATTLPRPAVAVARAVAVPAHRRSTRRSARTSDLVHPSHT